MKYIKLVCGVIFFVSGVSAIMENWTADEDLLISLLMFLIGCVTLGISFWALDTYKNI